MLTAFGEAKTVDAWTMDPRAAVWSEAILARLDQGMSPEEAISRPLPSSQGGEETILAFGERKTLNDWVDDPRAATTRQNIRLRLRAGWSSEEAIGRKPLPVSRTLVEAFGETKSPTAWAKDPRAGASLSTILTRLAEGWAPESAITTLTKEVLEGGIEAFGETKTLNDWAEDPRCNVTAAAISQRLKRGLSPEEAISAPSFHAPRERPLEAKDYTAKGYPSHTWFLTAFGETKPMDAWLRDPRCSITAPTLRERLQEGWDTETAIAAPRAIPCQRVSAFGETKTVAQWAEDPRIDVTATCIYQRLAKGIDPVEALTTPAKPMWEQEAFQAFGETKTLREWSADARCKVSYGTLQQRLSTYGIDIERAISAPVGGGRTGPFGTIFEAFGERKPLAEWLVDARCAVARETLEARVRVGWRFETALTKPSKRSGSRSALKAA